MKTQQLPQITKHLLSRLTHHVRNPFNGIIGFTDLLNNHYTSLSDEDKLNYIKIVHQLSKKALLRNENLAWWLKFYADNLTPVVQNLDITDLIREELNYFAAEFQKQHLDLMEEYNSNAMVQTDKVMVQNVVKNILLNIVDYTPVGEEVNIKVDRVGNTLEVLFNNVYTETPADETLAFISSYQTSEVDVDTMPGNPGLWTVNALCKLLDIGLTIDIKNNLAEVKLAFKL
jgi:signal transduction histidine kinase